MMYGYGYGKEMINTMKTTILQPIVCTTAVTLIACIAGCSAFTNMRGNTQYGADKRMASQVEDALKKDPLYKYPNVSVNVYRGEAQLGGIINQEKQRERAIKDAMMVPGILGVQDNMTVNTNPPVMPE
jgi:osmotically-inducible protein OsmY